MGRPLSRNTPEPEDTVSRDSPVSGYTTFTCALATAALLASVIMPVNAARSAWAKQQLNPTIHVIKRFFAILFLLNAKAGYAVCTEPAATQLVQAFRVRLD